MLSLSGSFPGAHFVAFALSVGVVAVSAMLVAGIKKIAKIGISAATVGLCSLLAHFGCSSSEHLALLRSYVDNHYAHCFVT